MEIEIERVNENSVSLGKRSRTFDFEKPTPKKDIKTLIPNNLVTPTSPPLPSTPSNGSSQNVVIVPKTDLKNLSEKISQNHFTLSNGFRIAVPKRLNSTYFQVLKSRPDFPRGNTRVDAPKTAPADAYRFLRFVVKREMMGRSEIGRVSEFRSIPNINRVNDNLIEIQKNRVKYALCCNDYNSNFNDYSLLRIRNSKMTKVLEIEDDDSAHSDNDEDDNDIIPNLNMSIFKRPKKYDSNAAFKKPKIEMSPIGNKNFFLKRKKREKFKKKKKKFKLIEKERHDIGLLTKMPDENTIKKMILPSNIAKHLLNERKKIRNLTSPSFLSHDRKNFFSSTKISEYIWEDIVRCGYFTKSRGFEIDLNEYAYLATLGSVGKHQQGKGIEYHLGSGENVVFWEDGYNPSRSVIMNWREKSYCMLFKKDNEMVNIDRLKYPEILITHNITKNHLGKKRFRRYRTINDIPTGEELGPNVKKNEKILLRNKNILIAANDFWGHQYHRKGKSQRFKLHIDYAKDRRKSKWKGKLKESNPNRTDGISLSEKTLNNQNFIMLTFDRMNMDVSSGTKWKFLMLNHYSRKINNKVINYVAACIWKRKTFKENSVYEITPNRIPVFQYKGNINEDYFSNVPVMKIKKVKRKKKKKKVIKVKKPKKISPIKIVKKKQNLKN